MEFTLTSAFSTKVTWSFENESETYIVQWMQGDVLKQTTTELTSIVLLNMDPSTTYEVRVVSGEDTLTKSFKTYPESKPELQNLYESIKLEDGTYDATNLDKKAHDVFLQYFNDIVKNGDIIYTSVILKGASKNIGTTAVTEGSNVEVSGDENLFLPFTTDSSDVQTVTLTNNVEVDGKTDQTDGANVELVYSPETDSFTLGDKVYSIGDKFELFGRMVTVADGSIVLVFEDTVALVYPFDITTAANVTGGLGSQFSKNTTCNVLNIVGLTTTGVSGSTHNSAWIYDGAAVFETSRIVHTLDATTDTGKISIGVRHTDGLANVFIEPVIQCESTSTTISAQDASDNTISTTINSTGITFDNDDSAIYFGSAQTFRIILIAGTPNVLAIQSYDSVTDSYVSRMDFSDST